jgi:hypothetical protein
MVAILNYLVKTFIAHFTNTYEGLLVLVFYLEVQTKLAFEYLTAHAAQ